MDCRRELMARPVGTTELSRRTRSLGGHHGDLPVVFPAGTAAAYQVDKGSSGGHQGGLRLLRPNALSLTP